jgi:hypothetical protein
MKAGTLEIPSIRHQSNVLSKFLTNFPLFRFVSNPPVIIGQNIAGQLTSLGYNNAQ